MLGSLAFYLRISYLEEKLLPERFVWIHKSFIVALDHILAVSATYIRINNEKISISRIYKAKPQEVLPRN